MAQDISRRSFVGRAALGVALGSTALAGAGTALADEAAPLTSVGLRGRFRRRGCWYGAHRSAQGRYGRHERHLHRSA